MTVKYVGPKPLISHTGIEFDTNKEDKYVYLSIALQLVEALDHTYIDQKVYNHPIQPELSDAEIELLLKKRCTNLEEIIEISSHDKEEEYNEVLQRAEENMCLNGDEKCVLEDNVKMMHDYMIQRCINKKVYYCVIDLLADIVEKDHIDHIKLPMQQNYYHVLHSLQGALQERKAPVDTSLEIFQDDNNFFVNLKVVNILDK